MLFNSSQGTQRMLLKDDQDTRIACMGVFSLRCQTGFRGLLRTQRVPFLLHSMFPQCLKSRIRFLQGTSSNCTISHAQNYALWTSPLGIHHRHAGSQHCTMKHDRSCAQCTRCHTSYHFQCAHRLEHGTTAHVAQGHVETLLPCPSELD